MKERECQFTCSLLDCSCVHMFRSFLSVPFYFNLCCCKAVVAAHSPAPFVSFNERATHLSTSLHCTHLSWHVCILPQVLLSFEYRPKNIKIVFISQFVSEKKSVSWNFARFCQGLCPFSTALTKCNVEPRRISLQLLRLELSLDPLATVIHGHRSYYGLVLLVSVNNRNR